MQKLRARDLPRRSRRRSRSRLAVLNLHHVAPRPHGDPVSLKAALRVFTQRGVEPAEDAAALNDCDVHFLRLRSVRAKASCGSHKSTLWRISVAPGKAEGTNAMRGCGTTRPCVRYVKPRTGGWRREATGSDSFSRRPRRRPRLLREDGLEVQNEIVELRGELHSCCVERALCWGLGWLWCSFRAGEKGSCDGCSHPWARRRRRGKTTTSSAQPRTLPGTPPLRGLGNTTAQPSEMLALSLPEMMGRARESARSSPAPHAHIRCCAGCAGGSRGRPRAPSERSSAL